MMETGDGEELELLRGIHQWTPACDGQVWEGRVSLGAAVISHIPNTT